MTFNEKYGKYALVTGASSGIGKALAIEVAKKGLNVVLVARGIAELEATKKEITAKYKVDVQTVSADLGNPESIEALIAATNQFEIGLFIPTAGMETNGLFTKISLERELAVIQINVVSTLQLTHHFTKKMIERKRGGVLLVSSLSGHMPNPYFANYAGAKAYILNFGLSLYAELRGKNIDVSILSPGLTNTPMAKNTGMQWDKTPMKPMEASEVAAIAISKLGKVVSIVPGGRNKMMAFMAKFMTPFAMGSRVNEKMMRKAMDPSKL